MNKQLTRYYMSLEGCNAHGHEIEPVEDNKDGNWIKHEDYLKQKRFLLEEIERLKSELKAADSVNEGLQYKIAQSIPALMDCKNIIEQSESTIIGKTYMNMKCIEINRLLNDLTNQNK